MLENQAVTPQVNYEKPNPKIPLESWNLQVRRAKTTRKWEIQLMRYRYLLD
jgi:hypothetical protein